MKQLEEAGEFLAREEERRKRKLAENDDDDFEFDPNVEPLEPDEMLTYCDVRLFFGSFDFFWFLEQG